jgi:type I restriction enzyme M protein
MEKINSKFMCSICNAEFKEKRYLTTHTNRNSCKDKQLKNVKINKVSDNININSNNIVLDLHLVENNDAFSSVNAEDGTNIISSSNDKVIDIDTSLPKSKSKSKTKSKEVKQVETKVETKTSFKKQTKSKQEVKVETETPTETSAKKTKSKQEPKVEIDLSYLRLPEDKIIFELNDDESKNDKIKSVLSIIDRAHNILYQAENIVGQKALPIIMSLLFIKLIQPLLSDKAEEGKIDLLNKKHYIEKYNEDNEDELEKIFGYFTNLKNLNKLPEKDIRNGENNDAIKQMGEILKRHPITKNIYTEVNFIKCREGSTIKALLDVIDSVNFKIFENNEDVIGEIYEHFKTKYAKSDSKELGQFFTPRKLMKLILKFKQPRINEIFKNKKNISVYDSCMGTAGWLVIVYNMLKEFNCSASGGEVEPETYQYGLMNLILTLKRFPSGITCNSSLTHINNDLHDLITTNPPFNSKKQIKFAQIKNNFENDKYTKENKINIKDVYKLEKDDPPIQFLELDTYKLNENGMCIIVLPYGEIFFKDSYKKTREYFMKEVNVTDIILVPSNMFTHTGIKTCVIIFEKNKKGTQEINFLEMNYECSNITLITNVKIEDIKKEPCNSWYHMDYLTDKLVDNMCLKMNNFEWVEFGEVFTLEKGELQSSKVEEDENGEGVFITKDNKGNYKNINKDKCTNNGSNIFITKAIATCVKSFIRIKYYDGFSSHSDLMTKLILNTNNYSKKINVKYVYYFLKSIEKYIEKTYFKGSLQESLDQKNFNRMKIPLPPLEIQNKITSKIDSSNDKVKYMNLIVDSMKQDINNFFDMTVEIETRKETTEWIEFGKVFTLEKGELQSSKVEEVEDDDIENIVTLVTGAKDENFKRIIKQNVSYLEGENIFISENGNGDKRPVKYFNGECNYSDLLSHIKPNNKYKNKLNIKYMYHFLKKLQPHIEEIYQKGSCNQSLDVKNFNRMKIQIPTLEQQNKCIEKINEMEEIIKRWENDIENILTNGSNKFLEFLECETINCNKNDITI